MIARNAQMDTCVVEGASTQLQRAMVRGSTNVRPVPADAKTKHQRNVPIEVIDRTVSQRTPTEEKHAMIVRMVSNVQMESNNIAAMVRCQLESMAPPVANVLVTSMEVRVQTI